MEKRIEELEKRVKDLEARLVFPISGYPWWDIFPPNGTVTYPYPYQPTYQPFVSPQGVTGGAGGVRYF